MSNVAASLIFGVRNAEKPDPMRKWIAAGQLDKAAQEAIKFDGKIGKTANTAVEALNIAAKNDKLIKYAGNVVKFAGEYVNPLICASAGVKVLTSDDKTSALIQQSSALGAMFTVESLMKDHLDGYLGKAWASLSKAKCTEGICKDLMAYATKHKSNGKISAIAHGVAFVVGSCTAYAVGQKFGDVLTGVKTSDKKESADNKEV